MKIIEFTYEERKLLLDRIARGIPEWERAEFIDVVVLRLIRQLNLLELENIELKCLQSLGTFRRSEQS